MLALLFEFGIGIVHFGNHCSKSLTDSHKSIAAIDIVLLLERENCVKSLIYTLQLLGIVVHRIVDFRQSVVDIFHLEISAFGTLRQRGGIRHKVRHRCQLFHKLLELLEESELLIVFEHKASLGNSGLYLVDIRQAHLRLVEFLLLP